MNYKKQFKDLLYMEIKLNRYNIKYINRNKIFKMYRK